MYEIRTNHSFGFRSGQWAFCRGVVPYKGRDCYWVVFPDGEDDYWVVNDPDADYELRTRERS